MRMAAGVVGPSAVTARSRIAQQRVVDEIGPDRPDEVERAGDDDRAGPRDRQRATPRADRASAITPGEPQAGGPHAPPARGQLLGRQGPRRVDGRGDDVRAAQRRRRASASTTPSTSLSAIDAVTSVTARARGTAAGRRGPTARAAAPAGLWAPSSRTSRPSTVEQLQAPRPARPPRTRAVGRHRRRPGDAAPVERVEQRVGDRDVGGLVPTAQADVRAVAEARQVDLDPRRGPSRAIGGWLDLASGTPSRRARRRTMRSPLHRSPRSRPGRRAR